jgi:hypothetical protein
MKEFTLPDYNGGSIVNLMSSIAAAFGAKTLYSPLKILPPEKITQKNIVLVIIDGLGFEYLKKKEDNFLTNNIRGSMTSVFLPTTASAIATFLTGVAPQQHAFTGWHMFLKEIGVLSMILPFSPRYGGKAFSTNGIAMKDFLDQKAFTSKIKAQKFSINHKDFAHSDFTEAMSKNSKILEYASLNRFFIQIKRAIKSSNKRKYIYAYWPELDHFNHQFGVEHKKSEKHLEEVEKKFANLVKSLKGTNTLLIVTADHGFTNTPYERIVRLEDHPKMKECLTLPLCGEGRVAYCYVHPDKARQFEKYVKHNLGKYCYLFKSQELIDKNYFGLFEPNPKLRDRIGDYALIFKENYIIKDSLPVKKKKKKENIGHHGGVSKEEMIVPLILINC